MSGFKPGCGELHECYKCREKTAACEFYEDNEGHEDVRYTCQNQACGHVRWVDGIDS